LRDGYFIQADAAILMFDRTNISTYQHLTIWYQDFRRVCSTAPVIVVGNKVDIKHFAVKAKQIKKQILLPYFDVSAKSCFNFEQPFLHLARTLTSDPNLQFTQNPNTTLSAVTDAMITIPSNVP